MTLQEAYIHNRAVNMALDNYHKGIGSIRALLIKQVVTVDHIGTSTKQDIVDV